MQNEPQSPPIPAFFPEGAGQFPVSGNMIQRRSHVMYAALNVAKTLREKPDLVAYTFAETKQEVIAQTKAELKIPDMPDPDDTLEYWTDPIIDDDTLNDFIAFGRDRVAKVQPQKTKINLIWNYKNKEKGVSIFRPMKLFG